MAAKKKIKKKTATKAKAKTPAAKKKSAKPKKKKKTAPALDSDSGPVRCGWPAGRELDIAYHDTEWGVPVHDDRKLFEFMVLDAFQAGLNWATMLKKRENFRAAFDNFEAAVIARYKKPKVEKLMADAGIIRNRLKIESTITNAQAFLEVVEESGSFDTYIWQFVNHRTIVNQWRTMADVPATTAESDAMSKALKKRGFRFVGSTICYAFMQAAGMINDHTVECFRYAEVNAMA